MRKEHFLFTLFLIFLAGFSLRPGITSIAPLLGQIRLHFNASDSTLGLLTSIPVMCMGLLSPLAFLIARKVGIKATLLLGFAIIALGEILRLQTSLLSLLLATAFMVGIGEALIRPVLSGFIKNNCGERTSLAIGLYAASMGIGSGSAAIFSMPISDTLGSFQYGLAFWALPTLVCLAAFSTAIKSEEQSPGMRQKGGTPVSKALTAILIVLFALQSGLNYAVAAWLPQWLIAQGYEATMANQYTFLFIFIGTVTSLFYPLIVSLTGNKTPHTALLAGSCFIFSIITYLIHFPVSLTIILISIGVGILFPLVLQLPLMMTHTSSESIRLSGIVQMFGYLIGGAIPTVVGYMTARSDIVVALGEIVVVLISGILIAGFALVRITYSRQSEKYKSGTDLT